MSFKVVIPARYASTRLPAKPLQDIGGLPMVVRVAQQCAKSGAEQIVVATDHADILKATQDHGFEAVMTRIDHVSGTDRIAEVAQKFTWADDVIVVNVQGDEPLIDPSLIAAVANNLRENPTAVMSSACHAIHDYAAFINPNVVKVVLDINGHALYFSRAPIPYPRDTFAASHDIRLTNEPADAPVALPKDASIYRHIGVYAYRVGFLKSYANLQASVIEQVESLEQLRVLYHGYKISMFITPDAPATGVDTQQDLDLIRKLVG